MNYLDFLIVCIVGLGVLLGVRKGGVKEAAGILGTVFAFVMAMQLMKPVGIIIAASLGLSATVAPVMGFVVVFLAVTLGVGLLARLVESVLGAIKLGFLNTALGGVFGGLKAALGLSVLMLFFGEINVPSETDRSRSELYGPVEAVAPATWDLVSTIVPNAAELSEDVGSRLTAGGNAMNRR
ncbi:MAG: CvpA family protein [Bacteroidota bacterium]